MTVPSVGHAQTSQPNNTIRLTWKGRLSLLLFGFLLIGSLLEVVLRVHQAKEGRHPFPYFNAKPTSNKYWATYDPDLGYRQTPNYGDLNSDGLNSPPIGPKSGSLRILFLGDSVAAYGDNVNDTFVGHMRTALEPVTENRKVEVIDAGIKGYTNYQELLYLKKFGLKFQPDVVGVEFCLNDLHNFLHSFRVEDGKLVPATYQFSTDALTNTDSWPARLARHSYLLVWINTKMRVAWDVLRWKWSGGFSFDYAVDIRNAWQEDRWPTIESQMREVVELGRQHHFTLFLTVVPVAAQYNASYLARDRDHVLMPQRKLQEICTRLGIPYYDLYPDLKGSMFGPDGIHFTKEGRIQTGESLAAFLRKSGLLAGPIVSEKVAR